MPFLSPNILPTHHHHDAKDTHNDLRIIPNAIDHIAQGNPNAIFASIPKSSNLADGFRDLSYLEYARTIDRAAAWLKEKLDNDTKNKRIGYMAPSDLRYVILIVAAVKVGSQVRQMLIDEKYDIRCTDSD